jgi:hypothetical protein
MNICKRRLAGTTVVCLQAASHVSTDGLLTITSKSAKPNGETTDDATAPPWASGGAGPATRLGKP